MPHSRLLTLKYSFVISSDYDVGPVGLARQAGLIRSDAPYLVMNQAEPPLRLGRWAEAEQALAEGLAVMPEGVFAGGLEMWPAGLAAMRGWPARHAWTWFPRRPAPGRPCRRRRTS